MQIDEEEILTFEEGDHVSVCQHSDGKFVALTITAKGTLTPIRVLRFPQEFLVHVKELLDAMMCQRAQRILEESKQGRQAVADRAAALEAKP